eukprot:7335078-Alexandrium_andersonii.AAC.1
MGPCASAVPRTRVIGTKTPRAGSKASTASAESTIPSAVSRRAAAAWGRRRRDPGQATGGRAPGQ